MKTTAPRHLFPFFTSFLFVLSLLSLANSAHATSFSQNMANGKYLLQNTNFPGATASFAAAVAQKPADPEANLLFALSRVGAIPANASVAAFLDSIGVSPKGRNLIHWTAKFPKSGPTGNASALQTALNNAVFTILAAAQTNLANIKDKSATVDLTKSGIHFGPVIVDWGDVQMLRAITAGWTFFLRNLDSWNLNASFADIQSAVKKGGTLEALLDKYPNVLTYANPSQLTAARASLTNAIALYFNASEFIRNRPSDTRRLFNISPDLAPKEANFRTVLSNILAAANGPTPLGSDSRYTLNLLPIFNGQTTPRAMLPQFIGDDFVWGSVDPTFGNIVSGLSENDADYGVAKFLKHDARLILPGATVSPLRTLTNVLRADMAVGKGGGLFVVVGQRSTGGFIVKVAANGSSSLVHSFADLSPASLAANGAFPNPLCVAPNGSIYGTTTYGGDNNFGTLFSISPAGAYQKLASFDEGPPSGPLTPGSDGQLYGVSTTGGDGYGFIFSIGTNGQNYQDIYTFQYSDGAWPNGGLVEQSPGLFYGSATGGGDSGLGCIFKLDLTAGPANPIQTVLHSFEESPITNDGLDPLPLTLGADGNLYGAAQNSDSGLLFSITPAGQFTTIYPFTNGLDGAQPATPLVTHSGSPMFGLTYAGSPNQQGVLFGFLPGSGDTEPLFWGVHDLGSPLSIAAANDDSVYFAATRDNLITIYHMTFAAPKITTPPPATISALVGSTISLTVKATAASTFQWTKYGLPLSDGDSYAGTASNVLTIGPINAVDAGPFAAVIANVSGAITSAVTVLTVKPDTNPPAIKITSVTSSGIAGVATDNARVASVLFWITNLNNNPVVQGAANIIPGTTSPWNLTLPPPAPPRPLSAEATAGVYSPATPPTRVAGYPGSNIVAIQAVDYSGNQSRIANTNFFIAQPEPIIITKLGAPAGGTLVGPTNHQLLNIGQAYTITAKPNSNSWFAYWSGQFMPLGPTNNPTLRFLMEPGASIAANFTSNLFRAMAGNYVGLFKEDNVRAESSGMVSAFTVDGLGGFTGKLLFQGNAYSFSGVLPPGQNGVLNNITASFGTSKLAINDLRLGFGNYPRQVFGTVSRPRAAWQASLDAAISARPEQTFQPRYTALLLPGEGATVPADGYLLVTNFHKTFTLSGQLADGTSIPQTATPITEGAFLPVCVTPYPSNTGLLLGWLSFDTGEYGAAVPTNFDSIYWIKKAAPGPRYARGFTNTLTVEGSV